MKIQLGILVFLSIGSSAFAGGREAHGGTAVVCRSATGKITRAEMLDAYEARNRYGLTLDETQSRTAVLRKALARVQSHPRYAALFETTLRFLMNQSVFLESGVKLPVIDDACPELDLATCGYEQLAMYDERTNGLRVDPEIYLSLNEFNRAVLLIHEATYYLDREKRAASNSTEARALTAYLVAEPSGPAYFRALAHRLGEYRTEAEIRARVTAGAVARRYRLESCWAPRETARACDIVVEPLDRGDALRVSYGAETSDCSQPFSGFNAEILPLTYETPKRLVYQRMRSEVPFSELYLQFEGPDSMRVIGQRDVCTYVAR